MSADIADLDLLPDDIGVEDAATYPDPAGLLPPPEGKRVYRIVDWDFHRKKDGTIIKDQEHYPIFLIKSVQIVEPEQFARTMVPVYQQIRTSPQQRGQSQGSQFGDLLRAFDANRAERGDAALRLFKEYVEIGATFRGRGRWAARDQKYIETSLQAGGDSLSKEAKSAIYKKARIVGQKKFRPDGTVVGPSGETISARYEIGTLYPSHKLVKIE